MTHPVVSRPLQQRFLTIPQSPLCYWLRERFFELLAGPTLGDAAEVCQGLATADDARFVRFVWEVPPPDWVRPVRARRWVPFEKGGGYGKWFGHHFWTVDWEHDGARVKAFPRSVVRNEPHYFREGWTYSYMARGSLGLRGMGTGAIFSHLASSIFFREPAGGRAATLNCRFSSLVVRSLSAKIQLNESYVARVPIPDGVTRGLASIERTCLALKRELVCLDPTERSYTPPVASASTLLAAWRRIAAATEGVAAVLHTLEGISERNVFAAYGIEGDDLQTVLDETGTPAGWFPLIAGYDRIPELPPELAVPPELLEPLDQHERRVLSPDELAGLKRRLARLYEAGPGGAAGEEEGQGDAGDEDDEDESDAAVSGARIPIPAETFLEELSQKLEVHPISVYWLLRELREADGVVSPPELRRFVEDHFSVLVLRLLGHLWPRQVEAGEAPPAWADEDGIIPLTGGTHEPTLLARVRDRIAEEFGADRVTAVEREFHEITGRPLEAWLANDFFERHVAQFRKCPIAWHLTSADGTARGRRGRGLPRAAPAFACVVYYHRLDADLLPKLRTQYVGPLRAALHTELVNLDRLGQRTPDQDTRRLELETMLDELDRFEARLAQVETHGFSCARLDEIAAEEPLDRWTSRDGRAPAPVTREAFLAQERRYDPDLNDGVRVNIAPLQRAGLLAAEVLASKDVEKAITDRAAWRADERRWCREGKLAWPGWWPETPALRGLGGLS